MRFQSISFALATLAAASTFYPVSAHADEPKPGVINVNASGRATVTPDMAVLNLAVMREAATAREALDANTKAMAEVLKAMQDTGIAERDLQTSNFNIRPRYIYPKQKSDGSQLPPKIIGYTVNNSLTVRVRDLAKLGTILDEAVTLGVNSGGNIQFTTDNPTAALEEARKKAMANAIAKAKTLTEAAGVNLGRIVSISESAGRRPRPRPVAYAARARLTEAAAPVPVAAGENSYSVSVSVQWELSQ